VQIFWVLPVAESLKNELAQSCHSAQKTNFRGAQQLLRHHVDFILESKELGFNARVTQTLCSAHDPWHDLQINVCGPQAPLGEK
jgi:hypothetical protein